MSKAKLNESSQRFFKLLKLGIISFISMGVLIGYHGAPLINSLIGMVWFVFAVTAGSVVISALTKEAKTDCPVTVISNVDKMWNEGDPNCSEKRVERRRSGRSEYKEKVSEPA